MLDERAAQTSARADAAFTRGRPGRRFDLARGSRAAAFVAQIVDGDGGALAGRVTSAIARRALLRAGDPRRSCRERSSRVAGATKPLADDRSERLWRLIEIVVGAFEQHGLDLPRPVAAWVSASGARPGFDAAGRSRPARQRVAALAVAHSAPRPDPGRRPGRGPASSGWYGAGGCRHRRGGIAGDLCRRSRASRTISPPSAAARFTRRLRWIVMRELEIFRLREI